MIKLSLPSAEGAGRSLETGKSRGMWRLGDLEAVGHELTLKVGTWDSIFHTVQPNTRAPKLLKLVSAKELRVPTTWKMLHTTPLL